MRGKSLICLLLGIMMSQAWLLGGSIQISLDLARTGVVASNVVRRSLFFAVPNNPVRLGAVGIGSFSLPGSVILPFTATEAGAYKLVVTYGLTKQMRPISVKVDGEFPDTTWQNVTLWGTTPDYPWGSSALYQDYDVTDCRSRHLTCWTLSDKPVVLTPGSHTIEFLFPAGDILLTQLKFTTEPTPTNFLTPWTLDSYVPFPALDFTERNQEMVGDHLRITFRGWWQNLAPHPVSFQISASVTPRTGKDQALFQIAVLSGSGTVGLVQPADSPYHPFRTVRGWRARSVRPPPTGTCHN